MIELQKKYDVSGGGTKNKWKYLKDRMAVLVNRNKCLREWCHLESESMKKDRNERKLPLQYVWENIMNG